MDANGSGFVTARPLWRAALAEFLGTGLLITIVVGSGIAAQRLSSDSGLQLLENAIATSLGLGVLIVLLAPVSGAHFNPAVTLAFAALDRATRFRMPACASVAYVAVQCAGGIGGAVLANLMFGVPTALSSTSRATPETFLAEVVATAGLVLVITGLTRVGYSSAVVAAAVGCYIGAAYWFTSSTSFANPAVTLGRLFTDTFTGIAPESVLLFIAAQLIGVGVAVVATVVLFPAERPTAAGAGVVTEQS